MKKSVLITGASRGIGKEIALYLSKNGYDVILHYNKNKDFASNVLDEIESQNGSGRLISFNIKDREETKKKLLSDIEKNGIYYGVICNAGICEDAPFPLLSEDAWDNVLRTNLDGFYNVIHPIIMPMISSHKEGRIIVLSSISGLIGNRGQVNYSASKAGIIGASKSLALELAKHKITVNCVAPGVIESDMTKDLPIEEIKKMIPVRRIGTGKEVASLVNYLLSEDAGYITRQVISVNGGMI